MLIRRIKINSKTLNTLLKYFLRGALLIMPLALTGYLISMFIAWVDSMLHITIPGLGILITFAGIILVGYLGTTFFVQSFFNYMERLIVKVPVINSIYTSFKDLMAAFLGNKKKFDQPVLVTVDKSQNMYRIGFITQQTMLVLELPENMVAVYLPSSYSFSGDLCILPREAVRPLTNISSAEVMKFVLSGGVTPLQTLEKQEPSLDLNVPQ